MRYNKLIKHHINHHLDTLYHMIIYWYSFLKMNESTFFIF